MVQIYTGDGKGKTTAAVGLAVRAIGSGFKVYLVQFCKGQESSEVEILKNLGVEVYRFGRKDFIDPKNPLDVDKEETKKGLSKAIDLTSREALYGPSQQLIILDEILVAVLFKLISEEDVLDIIKSCPKDVELVLTGRGATSKIIEAADLVSDIKSVKHPYDQGLKARKGIEF